MQIDWLNLNELTSSPEDSPARTSAQQESERASRALDPASGPRCSELSSQHDRLGSSLRMFLGLELSALTGCSLTWQKQATPHGRSWWVLSMPARRTDDSGCGLLPTPRTCSAMAAGFTAESAWKEGRFPNLETVIGRMLLPTPQAFDAKDLQRSPEALVRAKQKGGCRNLREEVITNPTGEAGPMRLNPLFVAWMMGYPPGLLDVECPRSRRSATR